MALMSFGQHAREPGFSGQYDDEPLRGLFLNDTFPRAGARGYDLSPLRGSFAKRERDSAKALTKTAAIAAG